MTTRTRWIVAPMLLAGAVALGACEEEEPEVAPVTEEPIVTEVQPTTPVGAAPTDIAETAGVPVSQIIESPATWTGQTIGGEVRVVEVPTDRGFWIEDQGERLFAVIIDQPQEQPKDINAGQTIRLREAWIRDRTFLPQIPGAPLDEDTRNIAEQQPVFLTVDEANIEMLGQT